ncbi:MAG: hypothetical protein ACXWG9_13730 [Usitatibacter sp.]
MSESRCNALLAGAALAAAMLPGLASAALSDEIQVYADDINAPREFGLELHANATPKGRSVPDYAGEVVPNHGFRLTPEFSYGMSRDWEAGLYVPLNFGPSGDASAAGWKLRLKWLPLRGEEGVGGWFAGANGELSRLQQKFSQSRDSFELRIMGGYRAESWLLAVNPVFGWSLSSGYRSGTPDFSMSFKANRMVAEGVALGGEYYSELGTTSHILSWGAQANTAYATVDVALKSGWGFNFGIGRGVTSPADRWTVKAIFEIPI